MEHHTTTSKSEAERLLEIAEKLLQEKDFTRCKDFALLAQETEPLLEGTDQILAIVDVHIASEKLINNNNNNKQHDWYSIFQINNLTNDSELIKKQYRRLALLLHPDKNKYPFADSAFGFVADAWAVLSDPAKKAIYDKQLSDFSKVHVVAKRKYNKQQQQKKPKLPVKRSNCNDLNQNHGNGTNHQTASANAHANERTKMLNLWTACPYCYNLYEYSRSYDGCCVRCENCKRAFTVAEIESMPPLVPGREAYYCVSGFFPMGFVNGNADDQKSACGDRFPNWMPPMFSGNNVTGGGRGDGGGGDSGFVNFANQNATATSPARMRPQVAKPVKIGAKKRGRPRKNP